MTIFLVLQTQLSTYLFYASGMSSTWICENISGKIDMCLSSLSNSNFKLIYLLSAWCIAILI